MLKMPKATRRQWVLFGVVTALYLLFLLWVESWWDGGALVLTLLCAR